MTPFEEAVERRARAICERPEDGALTITKYDALPENWKEPFRNAARATFTADEQAGYVLVPEKATEEMIQAACDATFGPEPQTPEQLHTLGCNAANTAGAVKPPEEE